MIDDQEEYYDYDSEYYNYDEKQSATESTVCKDCNGNELKDGDAVTLTQDLKVKGTSVNLKRGTLVKNIRLTDNPEEIECHADKVKNLVLKTKFVKKH
jgi:protein PhnA